MPKYANKLLGMSSLGCVRIENQEKKLQKKFRGVRILCFWGTPKLAKYRTYWNQLEKNQLSKCLQDMKYVSRVIQVCWTRKSYSFFSITSQLFLPTEWNFNISLLFDGHWGWCKIILSLYFSVGFISRYESMMKYSK